MKLANIRRQTTATGLACRLTEPARLLLGEHDDLDGLCGEEPGLRIRAVKTGAIGIVSTFSVNLSNMALTFRPVARDILDRLVAIMVVLPAFTLCPRKDALACALTTPRDRTCLSDRGAICVWPAVRGCRPAPRRLSKDIGILLLSESSKPPGPTFLIFGVTLKCVEETRTSERRADATLRSNGDVVDLLSVLRDRVRLPCRAPGRCVWPAACDRAEAASPGPDHPVGPDAAAAAPAEEVCGVPYLKLP